MPDSPVAPAPTEQPVPSDNPRERHPAAAFACFPGGEGSKDTTEAVLPAGENEPADSCAADSASCAAEGVTPAERPGSLPRDSAPPPECTEELHSRRFVWRCVTRGPHTHHYMRATPRQEAP